jgi:DNA-binding protein HU-beta
MPSLSKADLVAQIAEKTGETKKSVEAIVDATWSTIVENVAKGNDVKVLGFGSFSIRTSAARDGKNPKTGEKIKIAASKNLKFSASSSLKSKF